MTEAKPISTEPEMKGWLQKWTNYIKGYQKRWFVLSNGVLSYYRYLHFSFVRKKFPRRIHTSLFLFCVSKEPGGNGAHLPRFDPPPGSHDPHGGHVQLCHFQCRHKHVSPEGLLRSREATVGDGIGAGQSQSHQSQRLGYSIDVNLIDTRALLTILNVQRTKRTTTNLRHRVAIKPSCRRS